MRAFDQELSIAFLMLALLALVPASVRAQNFVYVNDDTFGPGPNTISAYSVDRDGRLSPLQPTSVFSTGGTGPPRGIVDGPIRITVGGIFLFATNEGSNDISVFSINALTGFLTPVPNSPFATGVPGSEPAGTSLAVTPDNRFLYSANFNFFQSTISAYGIASNGALTPKLFSFGVGGSAEGGIKVTPDGKFLAISLSSLTLGPGVRMFAINPADGSLTNLDGTAADTLPGSFFQATAPLRILGLDIDCSSKHLFVATLGSSLADFFTTNISVFDIASNGALKQISGSPFTHLSAVGPSLEALLSPGDRVLSVTALLTGPAGSPPGAVTTLRVDSNGAPTLVKDTSRVIDSNGTSEVVKGSPYSAPAAPVNIATDEAGVFLYTGFFGNFDVFSIAPGGFLTPKPPILSGRPGFQDSFVAFPPKSCSIRETAAARAKSLLGGAPYSFGGKGYDYGFIVKPGRAGAYIGRETISTPYKHYNDGKISFEAGLDCSGLVVWSYNTGFGAWETFLGQNNPIFYSAHSSDLYTNNSQSAFLNAADHFDPSQLEPGDLLFFDYEHGWDCGTQSHAPNQNTVCKRQADPLVDHVAMYVGPAVGHEEGEVVEAYDKNQGVIPSSCDITKILDAGGCERARRDPVIRNPFCSNPKDSMTCISNGTLQPCSVTPQKPCFRAFKRPINGTIGLSFNTGSPIGLIVSDPEGFTITPDTAIVTSREVMRIVPGQLSYVVESNNDDAVHAPILKSGFYLVKPVPKPDASPSDTYSLTVTGADTTLTLAQNVPVSEIPSLGYGVSSTGSSIAAFIPVAIDIKPGELPNSINPGSKGQIPVAVLSSPTFDAVTRIDQTSLTFGHSGDEASLAFCNTEDVNGDGLLDLVCHFNTQSTGFASGDTVGILKGKTVDGILVRGTDSVRIVP